MHAGDFIRRERVAQERARVVEAMDLFQVTHGRAPARRELAEALEIHTRTMARHVRALLDEGRLAEADDGTLTVC